MQQAPFTDQTGDNIARPSKHAYVSPSHSDRAPCPATRSWGKSPARLRKVSGSPCECKLPPRLLPHTILPRLAEKSPRPTPSRPPCPQNPSRGGSFDDIRSITGEAPVGSGAGSHTYLMRSFWQWLEHAGDDPSAADNVATLIAQAGAVGVSLQCLRKVVRLSPESLDEVLRGCWRRSKWCC